MRSIRNRAILIAAALILAGLDARLGGFALEPGVLDAAPAARSPGGAAQAHLPQPQGPAPFQFYFPVIARAYPPPVLTTYNVLQYGYDFQHSLNDSLETWITVNTVGGLHRVFRATLPSIAAGEPVFVAGVSTPSGTHDLLFVTTQAGHLIALDAHNGTAIWSKQHAGVQYTTSSPAVDPGLQYVYSYGLDGYVHKHAIGDGTETTTGGWPERATLKPDVEKESPALTFATVAGTTYLYVANGGYPGDAGDYQGHITAINLATGDQTVFNAACSNQTVHFVESGSPDCPAVQTAIWSRPGVVYDPDTAKIYMATGNGDYVPSSHDWGDTVFALNPDGTGSGGNPVDAYTPTNFQQLQDTDADLGSSSPAVLPATSGKYSHLGVQGGKDALLRLLNMDNLSGAGGPGHTGGQIFSTSGPGGAIFTQPAVWTNPGDGSAWVFVATGSGMIGYQLAIDGSGNPSLQAKWSGSSGSSPIVVNGMVFVAQGGLIRALDPTSGSTLWSDNQIGGIHWETPLVASGMLYVADESSTLNAYATP